MKSKKNIYFLFPIVIIIWAIVIFQFFSFTSSDEISKENTAEFTFKPLKIQPKRTFDINVNYRDPFLGKMYAEKDPSLKDSKKISVKKQIKPQETIVWPTIKYKGLISDVNEKSKTYILIIDGKNYFMKIGDTENGIFLKSGDKESVYVKYKGNLNLIMIAE